MDYSKAKIYKIFNTIDDEIYVGSTCCPLLSQRLAKHKSLVGQKKQKIYGQGKLYPKMLEIGKEHFFIELLFEFTDCQNKHQLRKKEGEYITQLQPALNMVIAGRSKREWVDDNTEYTKDWKHQWYKDNGGKKTLCDICKKELTIQYMNRHLENKHS